MDRLVQYLRHYLHDEVPQGGSPDVGLFGKNHGAVQEGRVLVFKEILR